MESCAQLSAAVRTSMEQGENLFAHSGKTADSGTEEKLATGLGLLRMEQLRDGFLWG